MECDEKMKSIKDEFDDHFEFYDKNDHQFYIDIKMIQRNGKKVITTIENLFNIPDLDIKKLIQTWKKKFGCNVFIDKDSEDENHEKIIKMTGNQIYNVQDYLIKENICPANIIRIH